MRTFEQIRYHYEIEKKLANKLRTASKEERQHLYTLLYNELYRQVPSHPQLVKKEDTELTTSIQMRFLRQFLKKNNVFLEIGPGDCKLSIEVSKYVRKVYAIDVSEEITKDVIFPQNVELIISDGCNIPIPERNINIAYSHQLMEHLHPNDAFGQLQNIHEVLAPNGIYICLTPNRLSGPHDISRYFDKIATGFHLKEYTVTELYKLFHKVGFSKISAYIGGKGIYLKFPLFIIILCEKFLKLFPFSLRKRIARTFLLKALLGIRLAGMKKEAK